VERKLNT